MKLLILSMFGVVICFLILSMFISAGSRGNSNNKYHPSKAESLVNDVLEKMALSITKKYKIKVVGDGASMPGGGIRKFNLAFESRGLPKEELRILIVDFSREMLFYINSNNEIQQFLVKSPFTIENLEIIIYNHAKNGEWLYDPEIAVARLSQGVVTYKTNDPENVSKYKNEFKETYEEALQALLLQQKK